MEVQPFAGRVGRQQRLTSPDELTQHAAPLARREASAAAPARPPSTGKSMQRVAGREHDGWLACAPDR
jgi:hypothetical protein